MQRVIGFILLLCCIFALWTWTFDSDNVKIVAAGPVVATDPYGNGVDENGYVVPTYAGNKLSGDFYDAASAPLGFITDIANAFDSFRSGVVDLVDSAGTLAETLKTIKDWIDNKGGS